MGYYVDLEAISIEQYKNKLLTTDLLPSRTILRNDIDKVFDIFTRNNIRNAEELFQELKTKTRIHTFSEEFGVDEDYLIILGRELKSYRQPPTKIKDFPGVSEHTVSKLEVVGIKDTLQFFEKVLTPAHRRYLSEQTGIHLKSISWLTHLTDLCRIRWVNHTFAYVLMCAGYDSVGKVATADYTKLYEDIKYLNDHKNLYNGFIGLHDMKLCVDAAAELSDDIQF